MSNESLEDGALERKRKKRTRRMRWSYTPIDSPRVLRIVSDFYGPKHEYPDITEFRYGGLSKRDANYVVNWLRTLQRWPTNGVSIQRTHERRCQGKCSRRCTFAVVGEREQTETDKN